jgi:hypothetical protein
MGAWRPIELMHHVTTAFKPSPPPPPPLARPGPLATIEAALGSPWVCSARL